MPETMTPQRLAEMIRQAHCVVALTGAGVSTAAGIPDFRGPGGIYESGKYDPMRVFDIRYFRRNPLPFWDFTRDMAAILEDLRPTRTHYVLAEMEAAGLLEGIISQNIDPFHQQAGSKNVLAIHGSYAVTRCQSCPRHYDYQQMQQRLGSAGDPPPKCDCGGSLKPDVVFFGELVRKLDPAADLARRSDLMLALGSTLSVQPAGMLPELTRGPVVVVNKGPCRLAPAPGRWFIEADLDDFFAELGEALALSEREDDAAG
jgi:NAD-dependent deacetylase